MGDIKMLALLGIDKQPNGVEAYRVLAMSATPKGKNQYDWKFQCGYKDNKFILNSFMQNAKWLNLGYDKKTNKLKGTAGSLDRFNNKVNKPMVILSQLVTSESKLVGYKVADSNGQVKNIKLKALLAYGEKIQKNGGIPVQNAIFTPEDADGDKRAHYKSFTDHPFLVEELIVKKNPYAEPKNITVNTNKKSISKLEEIFTRSQLRELKLGKDDGLEYKLYANPNLSAKQMSILREALKRNVNIRPFASPDISEECMMYYAAEAATGTDIRDIINPRYNVQQLTELCRGKEAGVDISEFSDPNLSVKEMAEKEQILENRIYIQSMVVQD